MDTLLTTILCSALAAWVYLQLSSACDRCPALARHRFLLIFIGAIWAGAVPLKRYVIEVYLPAADGILHESEARSIAHYLSQGDYTSAMTYFGVGNRGYRFALGVFYAVTGAPEIVTYAIHAALAFWGLMSLLETVCRHAKCPRLPQWVVWLAVASPSALFWTTSNLKEGAVLWGICLTLRLTLIYGPMRARDGLFWPLAGVLVVGFLRPQILVIWLAAVGGGIAIRRMKLSVGIAAGCAAVLAFFAMQQIAPAVLQSIAQQGLLATAEEEYELRNHLGGSAIQYAGGKPIPVVSGLLLIWLRPYPQEAGNISSLIAGAEIWMICLLAASGWFRLRQRGKLLTTSFLLTLLVALCIYSFVFSYMYNMGLMVRQRLMVFPCLIPLAVLPTLVLIRQRFEARRKAAERFQEALKGPARKSPAPARPAARRARAGQSAVPAAATESRPLGMRVARSNIRPARRRAG